MVLGPNTRHLHKGDTNHVIFEVPSNIQGILRLTWNLALNVALLGSDAWLCLNNDVTKVWQSIKTKNWGPEGDSELLDQPSMEALRLRTVLL